MAALVAEAGGDDRQVPPLTQKLSQSSDTTLPSLKKQWATARQEIYTLRLSRADGPYTLMIRVANEGSGGMPGAPPGMPAGLPPMPPGMAPPIMPPPGTIRNQPNAAANEKIRSGIADATEIELGLVQLQADGQSVKLANQALTLSVPSDKMAIRVDKPAELKNFNDPRLAKLAVGEVTTPVDLLPQQDGSWRGTFTLPPDGKAAEIVLMPASEEYRQ
jgi:hypothetical protein